MERGTRKNALDFAVRQKPGFAVEGLSFIDLRRLVAGLSLSRTWPVTSLSILSHLWFTTFLFCVLSHLCSLPTLVTDCETEL